MVAMQMNAPAHRPSFPERFHRRHFRRPLTLEQKENKLFWRQALIEIGHNGSDAKKILVADNLRHCRNRICDERRCAKRRP
jgi:hypothetical protein